MAIAELAFLEAGAGDGILRGLVEEHELVGVLEREFRGVERCEGSRLGRAAREKREGDEAGKGNELGVHGSGDRSEVGVRLRVSF